jgi:predicted nucleic acid-binding protein
MRAEGFLDTNVLLYAVSRAPSERKKREAARALLARPGLGVSVQVLQEFYVQATQSQKGGYGHEEAVLFLSWIRSLRVQPVTLEVCDLALTLRQRFGISYWDAEIVAAARTLECEVLYSEDLSHGQDYEGVRVENPFIGR